MNFRYPPRVTLANLPTPVRKLERFSKHLGGPEIFIKRDDLTGFGLSGNKVRKLEFVAAEALSKKADVLITCGAVQSNHARATAVAAAQLGLSSHLVLRGQAADVADGNLLIDKVVGAEFTYITPDEYYEHRDEIMSDIVDRLQRQGRKPYVIPEGASDPLGAVGYLKAGEEITLNEKELGLKFDYVVCAVGSGGTYAGLLLATRVCGLGAEILGINVCDDEAYFVKRILGILADFRQKFGGQEEFAAEDIHIIDGYVGQGYGLSQQEEIDVIRQVARTEGLLLDPVYTGKAMYGLVDQIKKGRFKDGDRLLFLHSGGGFDIFPIRELFS